MCSTEHPVSISLADLVALGMSANDEGRAVALSIVGQVARYFGAAEEVLAPARTTDSAQLALFAEAE